MQLGNLRRTNKIRKLIYVGKTCSSLDSPKTLTQFVDENLKRNCILLELTSNEIRSNAGYLTEAAA